MSPKKEQDEGEAHLPSPGSPPVYSKGSDIPADGKNFILGLRFTPPQNQAFEERLAEYRGSEQISDNLVLDAFVDMVQRESFSIWDVQLVEGRKPPMRQNTWEENNYCCIDLSDRPLLKERLRHPLFRKFLWLLV